MESKIQTFILSVIAIGIILLVVQSQIIINELSNNSTSNDFAKNVNYKPNQNYAVVPVNSDGSINVNIKSANETIDVNIESCDSWALQWAFGEYPIPVEIQD